MDSARNALFSGDYREVREFYSTLRQMLFQRVNSRYPLFIAKPISYSDCKEADSWSNIDPQGRKDWFWTAEYSHYQKFFKRFDVAFRHGAKLVSLSYGVPTAHKTGLKINLIESTPFKDDKLGIKAFEVISYAAQVYAILLGANEIRIMRPSSQKTLSHYCSFGYEYVSNEKKPSHAPYCVMKLD